MPATLVRELIEGTTLDISNVFQRKVERVLLAGLTATTDPDPEIIWSVLTELTANGIILGGALTGHPNLVLQRVIVRGFTNNGCIADLVWETPLFGGPASALIIRRKSYMAQQNSNTVWIGGTRYPIAIEEWVSPTNANDKIDRDFVDMAAMVPMKAISVTSLVYGDPAADLLTNQGVVNNVFWQGFPEGYWLLTEYNTDISVYSGYYTKQATALTKVTHNWLEIGLLRSERTGRYAEVEQSVLDTLGANYSHYMASGAGWVVVGRYPMANFVPIFGLS